MTIWIAAKLSDRRVVKGPVHGNGGKVGDGAAHMGSGKAGVAALRQLSKAQALVGGGSDSWLFEPIPGCVAIYPDYSEAGDGDYVEVPLAGTVFSLIGDQ